MKSLLKKIISYSGYSIINSKERDKYNLENTFDYLIKKINKDQKFIIFDVGGNKGRFTLFFIKLLNKNNIKNYEIHFFEPNSKLIEEAKKNISNNKVIFNEFGLGNKDEIKEFHLHTRHPGMSSFLKTSHDYFQRIEKYEIEKVDKKMFTVDLYMKQNNIEYLDILKLDTQGYNTEVIAGSVKSLENQIIKLIYSEIILGKVYEKSETFYDFEKQLLKNNYHFFGIDVGSFTVQVLSRFYRTDISLDVFYTNRKFVDI